MTTDEKLTLYFYDDGLTASERREIEAALVAEPALAERYATLQRRLESLRDQPDVRAPAGAVRRWHDSIDRAARLEPATSTPPGNSFHLMSFVWGGAIAAGLALIAAIFFLAGRTGDAPAGESIADVPAQRPAVVPVAFTNGLQVHLRDSYAELAQLSAHTEDQRNWLLLQIVQQNRMFERAADANNAPDVARLLRAFEPILMRLANDDMPTDDAEALRAQLAFELSAMLTKLESRASEDERTL